MIRVSMESWLEPHIETVENELDITTLAVWETGSHAYNFAHEESDTDLTIVYIQPRSSYVLDREYRKGFSETTANIALPDGVEIEGWDVKRFRDLLLDSDPMVYEALNSPLAYEEPTALASLAEYATERVHPIRMFKNYQSSAQGVFKSQRESENAITNKYMFHTARNIIIARYIQYEHEFPHMDFGRFLETAPDEIFIEFDFETIEALYEAKKDPEQAKEVIEPINRAEMEEFFEFELEYEQHIPEETMDAEQVDAYISSLVNSAE